VNGVDALSPAGRSSKRPHIAFYQGDTPVIDKPPVSRRKLSPIEYSLSLEGYQNLCAALDEVQLFAAVVKRRASRYPELRVNRNTMAHFFEHMAQRIDDVLKHLSPLSSR
jgi:hypothetical protein